MESSLKSKQIFFGIPFFLMALFASMYSISAAASDCSEYLREAKLIEGAVPKLTDDGRIRAIVIYGESSFLAPKASLISKARTTAELKAKRAFSDWLRLDVAFSTKASLALEKTEATNERGETVGLATELTTIIETLSSNSDVTIEGLTKLDECVDTEQKIIYVQMGWRPDLAKAARGVSDGSSVVDDQQGSTTEARPPSLINEAAGYRKRSNLKDSF